VTPDFLVSMAVVGVVGDMVVVVVVVGAMSLVVVDAITLVVVSKNWDEHNVPLKKLITISLSLY